MATLFFLQLRDICLAAFPLCSVSSALSVDTVQPRQHSLVPRLLPDLSHSRGEKSGEGLESLLHHGLEMVDSVSTNRVHVTYYAESTISGP